MAITINFNENPIVGNLNLGKIGEHNATELIITVPTALSEDSRTQSYRVAFHTNGNTVLSEAYTSSPITISLWKQLTQAPRLSLQVIAYDNDGNFIGKSQKLSGFYFEPSVPGEAVEADGSNADLAHEILNILAKNAEQDARLTIDDNLIAALQSGKVDKVDGKGLSTEDFTTAEKNKLAALENYVLPIATTAVLGGVKVDGETIVIENGVIRATVQAGDYVRILSENSSGYSNYSVRALKDFHTEGKIVIYNECILEYSSETTNSIVYYFFDVKASKQKKLTVSGSNFATITVVNLIEYASNSQGISGTIKTVNQWLTQFYGDIETLKSNVTTLTSAVAEKQNKFIEVTFTPTNSADWTQGGTFDKTFSEMAAAVSNGNMLTLKVDGSASFHALQVGGGSSSTYWWFVWYTGSFYSIALHHTLPDDEVQVYKFKYASDSLTIDGTTKTLAEWITQINGYNTITIGQITNTVAWWINTLQTNKANNLVQIDQATKSVGEWLAWILDGQSIDRFSEVELALNTLSSQKVNLTDVKHTPTENDKIITEQDIANIGGAEVKNGTDLVIAEGSGSPTIDTLSLGDTIRVDESPTAGSTSYVNYYVVEKKSNAVVLMRSKAQLGSKYYTSGSSDYSGTYAGGQWDTYLNSDFLTRFKTTIADAITPIDIKYSDSSTVYTATNRKAFLATRYQLDDTQTNIEGESASYMPALRIALPSLNDAQIRLQLSSNSAGFSRTPNGSQTAWLSDTGGNWWSYYRSRDYACVGVCIAISNSAEIDQTGGTNTLVGMPTITYDGTVDKIQDGNKFYKIKDQDARDAIDGKQDALPSGQNVGDILMWNGTEYQSFPRERIAYTPMNYIQGNGNQYIRTNFVPTNNSRVKIHFKPTATLTDDKTPFGEKTESGYHYNLCVYNNTWYFDLGQQSVNLGSYDSSVSDYILDVNKNVITFNGVEHTVTDNTFTASNPICIFRQLYNGNPQASTAVQMQLLSFEAWEDADDAKTLDLVPRRNIFTDKYGMLNLLDYHFYGNDGSGDFTGN